ncbi:MAG TPA: LacI family DNA-binding transcriptional regulator [Geminicoccus sp.]|uniref:LacI family DNA-binding transcriptional regulator n=1 Tax=Geminicoccus sp. TaxID=2024832 RepID=UPI002B71AA68|nr:LacI family DNA-binding transcriptional regulator [Geminicoccus sp.]HWL66971.1 LacI family DNA-binding transcriptional regulator [Geminicoccus sp.]
MSRRPTIHAVAARAGVSTATVSKVVNGITAGVAEGTRARVEAAVRELGYRPNRLGRSLRTARNFTIGLAILDPSPRFLADPFTANLVAGLANYLNSRGFGLLLHGIRPGALDASFLIQHSEVDGLCLDLSGTRRQRLAAMRRVAELGKPFVVFQERPAALLEDACFIRQDDRGGAAALATGLLRRRPKRVWVIVSDVPWPAVEERVAGFRQVLEPEGVVLELVPCDETSGEAIAGAISAQLDGRPPPDLLLGQNDQIAAIALQVLRRYRLRVPEDVGVAGFNAFPFTGWGDLPLCSVRSRAYELGEAGAASLLERLEQGSFARREQVLPLELVPGSSA